MYASTVRDDRDLKLDRYDVDWFGAVELDDGRSPETCYSPKLIDLVRKTQRQQAAIYR